MGGLGGAVGDRVVGIALRLGGPKQQTAHTTTYWHLIKTKVRLTRTFCRAELVWCEMYDDKECKPNGVDPWAEKATTVNRQHRHELAPDITQRVRGWGERLGLRLGVGIGVKVVTNT